MINFSFIIPHHNTPNLLLRCINSIPHREDVEIIVVDDNSDDDKKPVIQQDNLSIIYIDEYNTKGAGKARNIGMSQAKGKWLLFADADDYYSPCISQLLDSYVNRNDFDVVYFNVDDSDPQNKVKLLLPLFFQKLQEGNNQYEKYIKFKYWAPWNKIFNREFILSNNITWEEIPTGNDARFVLTASSFSRKVDFCFLKVYNYMLNSNGITLRVKSYDEILKNVETNSKLINYQRKLGLPWLGEFKASGGYHILKKYLSSYGLFKTIKYELKLIKLVLQNKTYEEFEYCVNKSLQNK